MTPEQLSDLIVASLADLSAEGAITLPGGVPETVTVERPRQKGHGDYATNVALQLAKQAGQPPRDFAGLVADAAAGGRRHRRRSRSPDPGFLNISVDAGAQGAGRRRHRGGRGGVRRLRGGPEAEGEHRVRLGQPDRPGHLGQRPVGGGRRHPGPAARGDRRTSSTREYYFNDHGAQIDRFSRSLLAAARGTSRRPRTATRGSTSPRSPSRSSPPHPEAPGLPDDEALEVFRGDGVGLMFDEIKQTLRDFRVPFDVYFHENDLYESGATDRALARLRELGNIYEADGAVWLRTEKFGDDKDRVIVKSDGDGAYISGDAAYYLDKRERGFDRCIILLGADHHGYVGRMMALCAAFGDEPGRQPRDHHRPDGQPAQRRRGGADGQAGRQHRHAARPGRGDRRRRRCATRWSATRRDQPRHRPRPLDEGHQRQPGLLRAVRPRAGLPRSCATPPSSASRPRSHPELLTHEKEGELLRALAEFPRVVDGRDRRCASRTGSRATSRTPPRRTTASTTAAGCCRWATRSRPTCTAPGCALVEATRIVLANGLGLLGVSAPERM